MKLKAIYDIALEMGIAADPRGKAGVNKHLKRVKEKYKGLEGEEKKRFDKEALENPYSDTRILAGDPEHEVKRILVGIDMEVAEILLADRLSERGTKIDLILAHHPEGKALANLSGVMGMQADIWAKQGVPINVGDVLIGKRSGEVFRSIQPVNHNRAVDAARLLGFAFMCVHTPADNLVSSFLQKELDAAKPERVNDVVKVLRRVPEYQYASEHGAAPFALVGAGEARAGKVVVDMTGGTQGPEEALEKLADAGVGTLVGMHLRESLRKKAESRQLNVVLGGHIASDAIGFNLLLDRVEEEGVEIVACSGFRRVSRRK